MWFYIENFLNYDEFKKINEKMIYYNLQSKDDNEIFKANDIYLNEKHGRRLKGARIRKVKRVKYKGDFNYKNIRTNTINFFGEEFKILLDKTYEVFHKKGFNDIVLNNLWLQFSDYTSVFDRHRDGGLGKIKDFNCFTTVYYCHEHWSNNWGGSLKLSDATQISSNEIYEKQEEYFPVPNSLLVWSRDHPHWMTTITNKDVVRKFVGGCWYKDENKRIHD